MKRKPAPPRRPFWITLNKVLVALHMMSDEDGIIMAYPADIARQGRLGWRSVEPALEVLEIRGYLHVEDAEVLPWRIILDDTIERSSEAPDEEGDTKDSPKRLDTSLGRTYACPAGVVSPAERNPRQMLFAWCDGA